MLKPTEVGRLPIEFTRFLLYGKADVFLKRQKEGYTEVAFGRRNRSEDEANWVDEERVASLWAFFHPDGGIATYENSEYQTICGEIVNVIPVEAKYSEIGFQEYIREHGIVMAERTSLEEFLVYITKPRISSERTSLSDVIKN